MEQFSEQQRQLAQEAVATARLQATTELRALVVSVPCQSHLGPRIDRRSPLRSFHHPEKWSPACVYLDQPPHLSHWECVLHITRLSDLDDELWGADLRSHEGSWQGLRVVVGHMFIDMRSTSPRWSQLPLVPAVGEPILWLLPSTSHESLLLCFGLRLPQSAVPPRFICWKPEQEPPILPFIHTGSVRSAPHLQQGVTAPTSRPLVKPAPSPPPTQETRQLLSPPPPPCPDEFISSLLGSRAADCLREELASRGNSPTLRASRALMATLNELYYTAQWKDTASGEAQLRETQAELVRRLSQHVLRPLADLDPVIQQALLCH